MNILSFLLPILITTTQAIPYRYTRTSRVGTEYTGADAAGKCRFMCNDICVLLTAEEKSDYRCELAE